MLQETESASVATYTIVYWDFMIPTGSSNVKHDVVCPDGMRAMYGGHSAPLGWHHTLSAGGTLAESNTGHWRHALTGPVVGKPTFLRLFAICLQASGKTPRVVESAVSLEDRVSILAGDTTEYSSLLCARGMSAIGGRFEGPADWHAHTLMPWIDDEVYAPDDVLIKVHGPAANHDRPFRGIAFCTPEPVSLAYENHAGRPQPWADEDDE